MNKETFYKKWYYPLLQSIYIGSFLCLTIVLIVMSALFIPTSIWLWNHSALGNPLCEQMNEQGYYETEWDTVGYESCKLGYSAWRRTETNETCMDERWKTDEVNLNNFGVHFVNLLYKP